MSDYQDDPADLSVYGYRWTKAEKSMISFEKCQTPSVEDRRRVVYSSIPTDSPLTTLPPEIIHQIFSYLDPGSLSKFRLSSQQSVTMIDGFPPFVEMLRHAPHVLKALARTGLMNNYSITHLHGVLRSDRCEYCNQYGPYLYLLRCTRCCYACLRHEPRLASTRMNTARKYLGLSLGKLKTLPQLRTIPGIYNLMEDDWREKQRIRLVNLDTAYSLLKRKDRSLGAIIRHCPKQDLEHDQRRFRGLGSIAMPHVGSPMQQMRVQHGIWCRGCEDNWYYCSRSGLYAQQPATSRDYELEEQIFETQEIAFSPEEFRRHCRSCTGVMRLRELGYPQWKPGCCPEYRGVIERH